MCAIAIRLSLVSHGASKLRITVMRMLWLSLLETKSISPTKWSHMTWAQNMLDRKAGALWKSVQRKTLTLNPSFQQLSQMCFKWLRRPAGCKQILSLSVICVPNQYLYIRNNQGLRERQTCRIPQVKRVRRKTRVTANADTCTLKYWHCREIQSLSISQILIFIKLKLTLTNFI